MLIVSLYINNGIISDTSVTVSDLQLEGESSNRDLSKVEISKKESKQVRAQRSTHLNCSLHERYLSNGALSQHPDVICIGTPNYPMTHSMYLLVGTHLTSKIPIIVGLRARIV